MPGLWEARNCLQILRLLYTLNYLGSEVVNPKVWTQKGLKWSQDQDRPWTWTISDLHDNCMIIVYNGL